MKSPRQQQGAMAITMALLLIGLIAILGLVTVAQYYWAKRDAQKVADLAALSGAQHLPDCGNSIGAAQDNATANRVAELGGTIQASCGTWVASAASTLTTTSGTANAVKVVAYAQPQTIIYPISSSTVHATAIAARTQPIATFSVGTTLAATNNGSALGDLLRAVGIPLDEDTGTSLVGYNGLANVNITPAGLLKQLGIPVASGITLGDLKTLLAAHEVSVGELLDAIVTVAGQDQLVDANVDLLDSILAKLDMTSLPDIALGGPDGLFAKIVAPASTAQSALTAQIDALQLLATSIGVGTGEHAVEANLPIHAGILDVETITKVIEPPSIASGGVGATAHTAQIRTFIHIQLGTHKLVGNLLGEILGTEISLDLPMVIDLVGATATLENLCSETDDQGRDLARINVHSSILKVCVGDFTAENAFSKVRSCEDLPGASRNHKLLSISVVGANLLSLNTHFATEALSADGVGDLYAGETTPIPEGETTLDIGTTVDNLLTALTTALVANQEASLPDSADPDALAQSLWDATNTSKSNHVRLQNALDQLQSASSGLQGLLANPVDQVTNILGNTLSLDVPGILNGVGGLLGSVVGALGNILGNTFCLLGSDQACINLIGNTIQDANTPTYSGSLLSALGLVAQTLKMPLDLIGQTILTPLIRDVIGFDLGKTDVHLHSLQCHRTPQLVY